MFLYTRIPYQKTSKFLKVLLWALLQHTNISLWFWPGLVRPIVYTVSLFSLCFECEHFIQIYWAEGLKLRSYIMLYNGLFLADFKLIRIKIYKFFYGFFHFKKRHISKKNKSEQVSNPLLTRMFKPILSPSFSLSFSFYLSQTTGKPLDLQRCSSLILFSRFVNRFIYPTGWGRNLRKQIVFTRLLYKDRKNWKAWKKSSKNCFKKKYLFIWWAISVFNFGNITDNLNHLDLHFISDNKKLSFGFMEMS